MRYAFDQPGPCCGTADFLGNRCVSKYVVHFVLRMRDSGIMYWTKATLMTSFAAFKGCLYTRLITFEVYLFGMITLCIDAWQDTVY